jgi:A/G-specific adenine glycosylase
VHRCVLGSDDAGPATVRDLAVVDALLPGDEPTSARLSAALMELGALVCVARTPRCGGCPFLDRCAWVGAGSPVYEGPTTRPQRFTGTDRQVRGLLMGVLRESAVPVGKAALDVVWHDAGQRERALDSLVADGLVDPLADGRYALPR